MGSSGDVKEACRSKLSELVARFESQEADYLKSSYNESQLRTDFVTPFLEAFGWDVRNTSGKPLGLREVVEEAYVDVENEPLSKRPDYELRVARQRKLFIEAKKPAVKIEQDKGAAFQVRRYGYSAGLPVSVLTNFHFLAIYDCVPRPDIGNEAHIARPTLIHYKDYLARFDDIWAVLSREALYSGAFDRQYNVDISRQGSNQFDELFLAQVRSWRERLARDIHSRNPKLTPAELTFAVQLFLSRLVFLRICEDRELEKYETLRGLGNENTFTQLTEIIRKADSFYDSGLFDLLSDKRLGLSISDGTLKEIVEELYYPQSPYTFAVVQPEVLGEIYEQFLGEIIIIADGVVNIERKPEVRESGGVVPTPRYIVDAINEKTLGQYLRDKRPEELRDFTTADICCGSGIFLISAYEQLLEYYLSYYVSRREKTGEAQEIYEGGGGEWKLTFAERRRILLAHLRGVDIDANAVEVARFSLLLKLIEGQSRADLDDFVSGCKAKALPALEPILRCGNSLVSEIEWRAVRGEMSGELRERVNPFNWKAEYPIEMGRGGFDIIVGNPPYIRIQNMVTYSPEEAVYFQNSHSPYSTAHQDNFDKYALFIERSVSLVRDNGLVGVIVPHKFTAIQAGKALREMIANSHSLRELVHFGAQQVFGPGTSNYTCILILARSGSPVTLLEQVSDIYRWKYGEPGTISEIENETLTPEPWEFANAPTRDLIAKVRGQARATLDGVADIFVGVQTSADGIYIFKDLGGDENFATLRAKNEEWPIEREILRPCLLDVRLEAYERPNANAWMIFPYRLRDGEAHLIQPDEMARSFPNCWAYLNSRRELLEKRKVTGGIKSEQQWYQFGRSQSLTKFDSAKIVLPILSLRARYAYDDSNIVVTGGGNGPYYMVRTKDVEQISDYEILALLNHPVCEAIVRTHTSTFRGGYYSHGKQFIEGLPVPKFTDEQSRDLKRLVAQLISARHAAGNARLPHDRELHSRHAVEVRLMVEDIVSAAYGLTADELSLARAVPIPA